MSDPQEVKRNGRSLPVMVKKSGAYEESRAVELRYEDDEYIITGVFDPGNPIPFYSVEVACKNDLDDRKVEKYIERFHQGDELVSVTAKVGRDVNEELYGPIDESAIQKYFNIDFDPTRNGYSEVRLRIGSEEHPQPGIIQKAEGIIRPEDLETGELSERDQKIADTVTAIDSTIEQVDIPELGRNSMKEYWNDQLLTRNADLSLKNIFRAKGFRPSYAQNLSSIEIEGDKATPSSDEIAGIYRNLTKNGWKVTVGDNTEFSATNRALRAIGFSEDTFDWQFSWIEEELEVSNAGEFELRSL